MKKFAIVLLTSGLIVSQVEAQNNTSGSINGTGASNSSSSNGTVCSNLVGIQRSISLYSVAKTSKARKQAISSYHNYHSKLKKLNFGLSLPKTQRKAKKAGAKPSVALTPKEISQVRQELSGALQKNNCLVMAPGIVTE